MNTEGGGVLDGIFDDPSHLVGKSLTGIKALIGNLKAPWVEGTLGKGAHTGQGWTVRESSAGGEYTDRYLQWHPGGGRHGPDPYWKVSSGVRGTVRLPSSGV